MLTRLLQLARLFSVVILVHSTTLRASAYPCDGLLLLLTQEFQKIVFKTTFGSGNIIQINVVDGEDLVGAFTAQPFTSGGRHLHESHGYLVPPLRMKGLGTIIYIALGRKVFEKFGHDLYSNPHDSISTWERLITEGLARNVLIDFGGRPQSRYVFDREALLRETEPISRLFDSRNELRVETF